MLPVVEFATLKTGDYSIKGHSESGCCVERKSLSDLFGSVGKGRERLEAEFERMQAFEYAAIIIERSLGEIIKHPPVQSKMLPKAVFQTLCSWSVKYNVHVWAAEDRILAEKLCFSLFRHYWKMKMEEI